VDKRGFVQSDLGDYIHPDSTFNFDAIRRLESIPPVEETPAWKQRLWNGVGCLIAMVLLASLMVGFGMIVTWIVKATF
jgi:hypothetical protein